MALYLIITLLLAGAASTAFVFLAMKRFKGSITKSIADQCELSVAWSQQLDGAIDKVLTRTDSMTKLDEIKRLSAELSGIEKKKSQEIDKLKELEKKLHEAQETVDKREAHHNKIKMGKEDCEKIADELRVSRETLSAQAKKLEQELESSREQMQTLAMGVELTAEQRNALAEISQHLGNAGMQLKESSEVYQQAMQRFINLQGQYAQLEIEYKNLVEQQLGGD